MSEGKHQGGRPLKFKSVEELENKIQEYFNSCYDYVRDMFGNRLKDKEADIDAGESQWIMKKIKPFTVTGLAYHLDTSRETLMDYEKGKYDESGENIPGYDEKFSDTIKKAKLAIYADTEEYLFSNKATGAIFSLKNNYKWRDKSEIDNTGHVVHKWEEMTDEQLEAAIKARKDRVA